jgi:hypothetical protein
MTAIRVTGTMMALVLASACGGRHHLEQYNFSNRRVALVFLDEPSPELLHGWFNVRPSENAVQTVFRAGASVAKEIEARKAIARFDSASRQVDFRDQLARRTLERASRYLGTRAVQSADSADFLLEIQMKGFGLDARSNNATYMFTRAEAVLLDRRTGREIWHENVRGSDQMTPWVYGGGRIPSAGISAITLSTVSVAEFREALEQLTTFTSDLITNDLRRKLRDVRE